MLSSGKLFFKVAVLSLDFLSCFVPNLMVETSDVVFLFITAKDWLSVALLPSLNKKLV